MLAYNTDVLHRRNGEKETTTDLSAVLLPWLTVFCPLFVLALLMFCSLMIVLYSEVAGYYQMTSAQLAASILYTLSLGTGSTGQVMLLEHIEFHSTTLDIPSIMLFSAWSMGSLALYIISRQEVKKLMASRGGAVPVPLTRTAAGSWVTNHAVTDRWMLLGDIRLTATGLERRSGQRKYKRTTSDMDPMDLNSESWICIRNMCGSRWLSWCCCCFRFHQISDVASSDGEHHHHPESRLKNVKRKNSGSYSDLHVDM
jgi:hypothetical protein